MPTALVLPEQYSLLLGVAVGAVVVDVLHVYHVAVGRHVYGIKAPATTASPEILKKHPDAGLFDCAFRAHANYTENLPSFLILMGITGLRYPVLSAGAGAFWLVGRVAYLYGYINKGKTGAKARGTGFAMSAYTQIAMLASAAYSAYTFIF